LTRDNLARYQAIRTTTRITVVACRLNSERDCSAKECVETRRFHWDYGSQRCPRIRPTRRTRSRLRHPAARRVDAGPLLLYVSQTGGGCSALEGALDRVNCRARIHCCHLVQLAEYLFHDVSEPASPDRFAIVLDMPAEQIRSCGILSTLRRQATLREVPVLVLTSLDESSAVDEFFNAGATGVMVKTHDWLPVAKVCAHLARTLSFRIVSRK